MSTNSAICLFVVEKRIERFASDIVSLSLVVVLYFELLSVLCSVGFFQLFLKFFEVFSAQQHKFF